MKTLQRLASIIACSILLTACGSGSSNPTGSGSMPPPPVVSASAGHGHFRGTITNNQASYIVEGLITIDDDIRLAIFGPNNGVNVQSGSGMQVEDLDPAESSLFVGQFDTVDGDVRSGSGVIIGQSCWSSAAVRFCSESAFALIDLTVSEDGSLDGVISLNTSRGDESWVLSLAPWSAYYQRKAATSPAPSGTFKEALAEFAAPDDLIISIDAIGNLFFQASTSGCIANGNLGTHGNGEYYVFDVNLTIENCNGNYANLNGEFYGLATETQNGYWDYDEWLLMFLSTSDQPFPRSAVTMFAMRF